MKSLAVMEPERVRRVELDAHLTFRSDAMAFTPNTSARRCWPPLTLGLMLLMPAVAAADTRSASGYEDVDAVLREIRPRLIDGYVQITARQVYETFGDSAVPQAAAHFKDPNDRVRFWAGGILFHVARSSQDAKVQRRAVREIIGGLRGNQTMARWLSTFPAHAFDAEAKRGLVRRIRASDNHHLARPLITAAGIADARAIEPDLQRWAADHESRVWWASNLALARMGDHDALDRVMKRVGPDLPPPDTAEARRLPTTIQQLCYIKQPRAIEWVIKALKSELVVPNEGDILGFSYSRLAAVYLGQVLDMPHSDKDRWSLDVEDVKRARKWIRQNYSLERFSELLGGELQDWFW